MGTMHVAQRQSRNQKKRNTYHGGTETRRKLTATTKE